MRRRRCRLLHATTQQRERLWRTGDIKLIRPILPRHKLGRRRGMLLTVVAAVCALVLGHAVNAASWDETLAEARGQTVYWHAWGGDPQVNAYIDWVGDQVEARHGIDLVHVKLTDTAEAVARVVAEKAAGRDRGRRRRPDLDQRRELRLDEGAGPAVRPVRARPAELPLRRHHGQADHAPRLHGADRRPRGALGHGPVRALLRRRRRRRAAALDPGPARMGRRPTPAASPTPRRPTSSAPPS